MGLVIFIMGFPLWCFLAGRFMTWMDDKIREAERDTTVYKNCDVCEYGCNWTNPCTLCECHYER